MFACIVLVYVCCPLGMLSGEGGVLGPLHSPHCPGSDFILYNHSIPRTLFMIWGPHLVPSTGIQSPSREVLLVLTRTRADLSQRVGSNSLFGWYNTCRGMGK